MVNRKRMSISAEVRHSVSAIVVLLALPVLISLATMFLYSSRYQAMMQRMNAAAEMKPALESEIAEELFSVAAGRMSFEDSGVMNTMGQVKRTLDQLTGETEGSGHLQLTIARRTMDTMEQYVLQVRNGMTERKSIDEIEKIVDEVRNVGRLVTDMLDAFISEEIENASETNRRLYQWMLSAAGIEILLLTCAFIYSRKKTDRLTESIHITLSSMENTVRRIAQGNFGDRVRETDVEELQILGDQINEMANQLEALIRETREKTEHLSRAELRTLQAQINPHFLYNTLDTIVWQAESGKREEVVQLTSSLSDFFRISLSSGADWIPVPQEMKHVSAYLSIQKIRYRDILDYDVDECEDLQEVFMPKLLLQPLVENALYHGIKNKRGGGKISVQVKRQNRIITFTVADNGKGMDPEKLKQVESMLNGEISSVQSVPESAFSGFGIKNVDMRIRLYYKKKTGLIIQSGQEGTEVSFTIPIRTREEIDHDESLSRG